MWVKSYYFLQKQARRNRGVGRASAPQIFGKIDILTTHHEKAKEKVPKKTYLPKIQIFRPYISDAFILFSASTEIVEVALNSSCQKYHFPGISLVSST